MKYYLTDMNNKLKTAKEANELSKRYRKEIFYRINNETMQIANKATQREQKMYKSKIIKDINYAIVVGKYYCECICPFELSQSFITKLIKLGYKIDREWSVYKISW